LDDLRNWFATELPLVAFPDGRVLGAPDQRPAEGRREGHRSHRLAAMPVLPPQPEDAPVQAGLDSGPKVECQPDRGTADAVDFVGDLDEDAVGVFHKKVLVPLALPNWNSGVNNTLGSEIFSRSSPVS